MTSSRRGARNSQPRNSGGRSGSSARRGNRWSSSSMAILMSAQRESVPGAEMPPGSERDVHLTRPEDVETVGVGKLVSSRFADETSEPTEAPRGSRTPPSSVPAAT